MLYEKLIDQYNNLDDIEKNALLVYKSRLGRAINSLNNNDQEVKDIYEQYKKLLVNPKNLFIAYTVFKNISFDNLDSFKESLKVVDKIVRNTTNKLILPEDITVYRVVSIKNDEKLNAISKSNLISTSLNINECSKFIIPKDKYKTYLYQINLEKDSKVAICPYSILLNEKEEQLTITSRKDQEELLLSKDNYNFTEILSTNTKLESNNEINIIVIDALKREYNKARKI